MYCALSFQRLIQTEADLMRLEEVHASLFREHKNLQEDYERIHVYVEVSTIHSCTHKSNTFCKLCTGIGNEIRS